ncbi:MAG: GNAT family N-acetyltransferase [Myxococcales bacterium]|nr:GNAT family N-acetyltransferase [Myxococcales bacterium]
MKAWATYFAEPDAVVLVEGDGLLVLHVDEDGVRFAGNEGVTDYHSPLGLGVEGLLADYIQTLPANVALRFDSLPATAADAVGAGLRRAGLAPTHRQHEVAFTLDLPRSHEAYLASLRSKRRGELRRMRRRFADAFGRAQLVRTATADGFAAFVSLHREQAGDKGGFMTDQMASFFNALHSDVGAVIDVLVGDDGDPLAFVFGFEDDDTYYAYNSARSQSNAGISLGLVMFELLIEASIEAGRTRLDLLKGAEPYKARLGAQPRPLYCVTATT